ncbi:hypothetical protein QE152_g31871 [Popillia japonica]|uniref:Uncharacterized protein n=1 Tax=Popillia japonica TaxID=7064 RepID=A0AAW1J156_POPJA
MRWLGVCGIYTYTHGTCLMLPIEHFKAWNLFCFLEENINGCMYRWNETNTNWRVCNKRRYEILEMKLYPLENWLSRIFFLNRSEVTASVVSSSTNVIRRKIELSVRKMRETMRRLLPCETRTLRRKIELSVRKMRETMRRLLPCETRTLHGSLLGNALPEAFLLRRYRALPVTGHIFVFTSSRDEDYIS